ncbi:MAG: ribonuclease E/G, partial [Maritimibacter sp.]
LIDATHAEETRVVVVDGNKVEEFDFESENKRQLAGNIYLAKVTRVEPSLQAAFVDYGGNRHGFLAFSEIHPDYYQIPVADREALLEEEHAYAEAMAAEEEERDKKDKSRSNRSRRGRGRGRSSEKAAKTKSDDAVTTAEAKLPESMDVIDLGEDGDETQVVEAVTENTTETTTETAAEQASPDVAAEAGEASEAPAEAAQAEAVQEDAPVVEASAEPEAQADTSEEQSSEAAESGEEAQAESTGDEENSGDEASAEADAEATTDEGEEEAAAPKRRRRSRRPSKAKQDAEQDDDNDDDDDDDDDRGIESVAEEDVAEEIHRPRKPRPRKYKIQEVVKVRQILLVQVVKEERGNKGAALTTYLSLAGRYCVLMPNTARGGGISRKITNAADRKKLKEIATEIDVPKGAGLIIRTAGSQRTKAEIKRDYEYLQRLWEEIRTLTLKSVAPAKIYEEGNLIKRSIRDLYNREIDEVLVEGDGGYRVAKDFMKMIMPSHAKNVKHYTDALPLFARYQVESYLSSMFNPVVQLKSGGYIVIGVTEALVAIDVNSGRATKEGSIEDTALKTNLEAAEEVARQL